MQLRTLAAVFSLISVTGCASLTAPSPEALAALPVVTFGETPPAGDFVFRLPAGKPITSRVAIQGTALATGVDQTLAVTLPNDLYVHKKWVSEDGKTWKPVKDVLKINLTVHLPSDEFPTPGEMLLLIDRKDAK